MVAISSQLAFIRWDVNPEIFNIGPLALRWYGVLFMLGFYIGYKILEKVFQKEGYPLEQLDKLGLYVGIGTVLGARLGHCLFYQPDYYLANPIEILYIHQGGLASHGAAVGIILSMLIYARKFNKTFLWTADRVVITVALGACFIRLGNLMNSEIVGTPTNLPWAFEFVRLGENPSIPRHPSQLYEALYYLLTFFILYRLYWKSNFSGSQGRIFGVFLLMVFGFRFVIEFLKENQVDFENGLSFNMGQMLSIPFVLLGLFLLIRQSPNLLKTDEKS